MGENIGMAARAMGNFALNDLRLISPRDGWPNQKAIDASKHAHPIITQTHVYKTTHDALADARHVFAVTARPRDLHLPVYTPEDAAACALAAAGRQERCVFLFGKESDGLSNAEVSLASSVVTAPTSPTYSSLNLSQAVSLIGYLLYRTAADMPAAAGVHHTPAETSDVLYFLDTLERTLDARDYFRSNEQRESTVQALRVFLTRAAPDNRELGMLHGIIALLRP